MNRLFSMDSPVMIFLSHVGNLLLLNALWLAGCLPIITAGASTAALYRVLLKRRDGNDAWVWTTFFKAFRNNFKSATTLLLLLLIPTAIVAADCWILISGILYDQPGLLAVAQAFTLLSGIALVLVITYAFPLTAMFENSLRSTLKNAALLSVAHLPQSLLMAALNILPLLLIAFAPELFILSLFGFFVAGGALTALINSFFLRRIFAKHLPPAESES